MALTPWEHFSRLKDPGKYFCVCVCVCVCVYICFHFFFSFIFISWRLITLQYCSGFWHTLTWISHGFTCIPHPDPPSHLPLHPIPLANTFLCSEECKSEGFWTGSQSSCPIGRGIALETEGEGDKWKPVGNNVRLCDCEKHQSLGLQGANSPPLLSPCRRLKNSSSEKLINQWENPADTDIGRSLPNGQVRSSLENSRDKCPPHRQCFGWDFCSH